MQNPTAALDAPSTSAGAPPAAAGLHRDLREALPPLLPGERPLPSLVMEDAAAARQKRHAWPGTLFYGFSYFVAAAMGFVAVLGGISAVGGVAGPGGFAVGAGAGVWAVLQWRLAREVRHFTRWGWYGAMAELGLATAAKLWALAQGEIAGGLTGLAIDTFLLRYFWKRRADFDIDL